MRIIAGDWRGRRLKAPPTEGTRPTSARAREALFSMLTSELGGFDGLRVADIFAGTGALGLEAMSRGGAHCTFVENDRKALAALKANIAAVAAQDRTAIFTRTAPRIGKVGAPVDLVFLDAPYARGLTEPTLAALSANKWLTPEAIIAVETAAAEELGAGLYETVRERTYGAARVTLLRLAAA